MTSRRKIAVGLLSVAIAGQSAKAIAQHDDFPSRPITLVAPFPAGSVTDSVTRVLATALTQTLGRPVVVENKAGAQGTIGAADVANARPDGYRLLVSSSAMFVARSLYRSLPYDPVESFAPVAAVGSTSMMFLVAANSPIKGIEELALAARRAEPPLTIGYGSPSGQVTAALFATVTESRPVTVNYRGIPQAITDLLAGQVQVAIVDIGNGLAQVNGDKARALAISAAARYPGAPSVPTLQERFAGATGSLETIIAIQAPTGTPAPVIQKLETAIRQALDTTRVRAHFQALNTSVLSLSSADLQARITRDNPRWERLMKLSGIEPQ